jgi:hypothetical protein
MTAPSDFEPESRPSVSNEGSDALARLIALLVAHHPTPSAALRKRVQARLGAPAESAARPITRQRRAIVACAACGIAFLAVPALVALGIGSGARHHHAESPARHALLTR